ncbi:MAG: fatty acid desaturase [Pseudomonadota bacterium]
MKLAAGDSGIAKLEWQTLGLIAISYALWLILLLLGHTIHPAIWIVTSALNLTLFMSITHEVVHGHPTRNSTLNSLLILLPIGWSLPYERFRDTHLNHHVTGELTDPFDDPESWYLARHDWLESKAVTRSILVFNNTLLGRMMIGPLIGLGRFYVGEISHMLFSSGDRAYLLMVWAKHFVLSGFVFWIISAFSDVPLWQWLTSIYLGHSFLLVRTFLEHQAAPDSSERTVIIEQACPIAFLFLFNNYHFVHHDKPHIPWYRLPAEFRARREAYITENGAYVYSSYSDIFRRYFLKSKEPVQHPFLRMGGEGRS